MKPKIPSLELFIGSKIKALRQSADMSQEDLGKLIGLTRTSIINYETGRQSATTTSLYLIACIFKVPVSDLFPEVKPIDQSIERSFEEIEVVTIKKVKKANNFKEINIDI